MLQFKNFFLESSNEYDSQVTTQKLGSAGSLTVASVLDFNPIPHKSVTLAAVDMYKLQ